MPFAMVFIGLLMVISGMRDTHADLGGQMVTDVGGKGGFGTRLLAIGAVGSLGYLGGEWRRFSVYFMVLVLVALLFSSDKGFFEQLTSARKSGPAAVTASPAGTTAAQSSGLAGTTVSTGAASMGQPAAWAGGTGMPAADTQEQRAARGFSMAKIALMFL
jgi:hypothetical protein